MDLAARFSILLTVARARVFDFQDETQRARGLPHNALALVGDVVAGAHAVARAGLGTRVVAHRAAASPRRLLPQALPALPAVDVFARPGVCGLEKRSFLTAQKRNACISP